MVDQFDRAQELDARYRQQALDQQARRAAADHGQQRGRSHCIDCGEAIPEARRRSVAACIRCIECQTLFEG